MHPLQTLKIAIPIIEKQPKNTSVLHNLAKAYEGYGFLLYDKKTYQDAKDFFSKALKIYKSQNTKSSYEMIIRKINEIDKILENTEEVLILKP